MSVVKHTAILTTTIDRGHDKTTADCHIRLIDECMEVSILNVVRILHVTSTGTKYEAHVNRTVATFVLHTLSSNLNRTYLTTTDYNGTGTSTIRTSGGLTKTSSAMRRVVEAIRLCSNARRSGKRTDGTLQSSTIDTVIDVAVSHRNSSVAMYISSTTTTIDATIADSNLFCTFSNRSISPFTSLIGTDINLGVASHIFTTTATKDITSDMST